MKFTKQDLLDSLKLKVSDKIYSNLFIGDDMPKEFEVIMCNDEIIALKALNYKLNEIDYVFSLCALLDNEYTIIEKE